MPDNLDRFIDGLPKAELHLHIEGTLEPEMMLDLATRNKVALPYGSVEEVREAYDFDCLQDFLDVYFLGMSVLVGERDFHDLTVAYLEKVAAQGVRHVEIFFDAQAHTGRGIAFETVLDGICSGLEAGRRDFAITSKLILCFLRHLPEALAFETLASARRHREHIFGVGLDSTEIGNPPLKFSRVFAEAREAGFVAVAHAGEEGPASYVAEALDALGIERLDHGNRALDDPALVARLVRQQTPLTMCPMSNFRLKVIPSLKSCPVKTALDAGLLVTVNSDDPSYFGGYINQNYKAVRHALDLAETDMVGLARNSFAGSFLTAGEKQSYLDEVENYADAFRRG